MKAIISSTYDDQYLFFLPITTWLWNRLGVDVICFIPIPSHEKETEKLVVAIKEFFRGNRINTIRYFKAPEHKKATYSQCARLYAGALDLSTEEELMVSDIDMALFKLPTHKEGHFSVFGADLVPDKQYPMCYLTASAIEWSETFECGERTVQECLDDLLGLVEAQHFRGNYWGKDQEEAFNRISVNQNKFLINRARPGTQFASNRIDRDDAHFMERLSPDIVDYHMHRPGFTDDNFEKILAVIQYFYPGEDLTWTKEYREEYVKLL